MPRIPDEVIERLKAEVSLEKLAAARGVELKRHGADLIGLCPFHDDREPSLVVSPKKNLWNCLGACGAGGTVIDWVMRAEGVSFRHAVELLTSGKKHPEMIERFQLGFANRTLGYRLPASNRVTGAELRGRLQKLGVYRESGHEHFNGCLIIPIFSRSGEAVQIYGRK